MNILLLTYGNESSIEIATTLQKLNLHTLYGVHYNTLNAGQYYINKNYIYKIIDPFIKGNENLFIRYLQEDKIYGLNIDKVIVTNCKMIKFIYDNYNMFDKDIIEKFMLPKKDVLKLCLFKDELYKKFPIISPVTYSNKDMIDEELYFSKPIYGTSAERTSIKKSENYVHEAGMIECEYLPGEEFTVDCFCGIDGSLIDFNIRKRVSIRDGITSYGNSTNEFRKEINNALKIITDKIQLPYIWFAQFKLDKNGYPKLLEINCRVSGSFSITKNSRKDYISAMFRYEELRDFEQYKYNNESYFYFVNNGGVDNSNVSIARHMNSLPINKKSYVFDLDGTLCTETYGYYHNAEPIYNNISILNKLHDCGHEIIVHTARGMKRFNNDVAAVYDNLFDITRQQLLLWNVKYDKLIMGKPYGTYVDNDAKTIEDILNENSD